jgi:hypothetical protein
MRGDAAWYDQDNVGIKLNEWLQKHHNNRNLTQDFIQNIYEYNIVSHVFKDDESICCSHFMVLTVWVGIPYQFIVSYLVD